jgi:hypothetical protein
MAELSEHPSVKRFHERAATAVAGSPPIRDAGELRQIYLEARADDVGFVEVDRADLANERADVLAFIPHVHSTRKCKF